MLWLGVYRFLCCTLDLSFHSCHLRFNDLCTLYQGLNCNVKLEITSENPCCFRCCSWVNSFYRSVREYCECWEVPDFKLVQHQSNRANNYLIIFEKLPLCNDTFGLVRACSYVLESYP